MIVVDATVLADFLVGEEKLKARVHELVNHDPIWVAPSLWRYEVGNVLWKWIHLSNQPISLAERALKTAETLLEETVEDLDWQGVLKLATQDSVTFYDGSYLWLARALGIPLHTRDRKLLKQFPNIAKAY